MANKEIFTDYLPLEGGTMTGPIIRQGITVKGASTNNFIRFLGGTETTPGGYLTLRGSDWAGNSFDLATSSGTILTGVDKKLTWDGCPINYCFNRVAGAKTRTEIVDLFPLDYSTYEVVTSFATSDTPISGDNGNYHITVQRYNSNYIVMRATKYQRGTKTYQCYRSSGTWSAWSVCSVENKEALTGMTRATILAKSDAQFETTNFTNVRFTAAESPTGSETSTFNITIKRIIDYNGVNGCIIANNSMSIWHCNVTQGVIGTWCQMPTSITDITITKTTNLSALGNSTCQAYGRMRVLNLKDIKFASTSLSNTSIITGVGAATKVTPFVLTSTTGSTVMGQVLTGGSVAVWGTATSTSTTYYGNVTYYV